MKVFPRRIFLSAGAAITTACFLDMLYLEPSWLEVSVTQVKLFNAPLDKPIKLLHLSDLHLSREVSLRQISKAFDLGLQLQPDIICLTGDYITDKLQERQLYRTQLERLSKAAPVFAVMGNHDGGIWKKGSYNGEDTPQEIVELLREANITVLENENRTIPLKGKNLALIGLKDIWSSKPSFDQAFENIPHHDSTILLSHNPDSKDYLGKHTWDLMLSGHTHGGQLRIPFTGATPYAPVQDHRYVAGLNPWTDNLMRSRQIFTTRGVGNVLGLRFNCRPEVSLLELV